MAVLTPFKLDVAGTSAPSFVAASAGGDEVDFGTGLFVIVKNGGTTSITTTVTLPVAVNGAVSIAVTVPAAGEQWIAVPARNQSLHSGRSISDYTGTRASLSYSAVTSVTVAAVRAV